MPELIEVGRTGLLVEDFVEGYHQIEQCFEMDRAYIAQRARMLFNYETMTQEYIRAYERVIEIFATRREQDKVLRSRAEITSSDLDPVRTEDAPTGGRVQTRPALL